MNLKCKGMFFIKFDIFGSPGVERGEFVKEKFKAKNPAELVTILLCITFIQVVLFLCDHMQSVIV